MKTVIIVLSLVAASVSFACNKSRSTAGLRANTNPAKVVAAQAAPAKSAAGQR